MLTVSHSPAAHPGLALRARLTGFAGFLRVNGFGVGSGDSTEVLETAGRVGILDPQILRWSLKALLCGRGDEWNRFDELFDAYFLPPNKKAFSEIAMAAAPRESSGGLPDGGGDSEPVAGAGQGAAGEDDGST
ncbi:MAG: hypothetical protein WBM28_00135, partial [Burkholderiales bacterium]